MKNVLAPVTIWFCLVSFGCANDRSTNQSGIINPNGDSELALLMREMYDDGMLTKQQILRGEMPEIGFDHKEIYTAEATQPEKVQTTEFLLMAKAYEAAVDSLMVADQRQRPEAYQLMVNTCATCHQSFCTGPMVKIKKMYLSEKEMALLGTEEK